jgi:hypothetical protein
MGRSSFVVGQNPDRGCPTAYAAAVIEGNRDPGILARETIAFQKREAFFLMAER